MPPVHVDDRRGYNVQVGGPHQLLLIIAAASNPVARVPESSINSEFGSWVGLDQDSTRRV